MKNKFIIYIYIYIYIKVYIYNKFIYIYIYTYLMKNKFINKCVQSGFLLLLFIY